MAVLYLTFLSAIRLYVQSRSDVIKEYQYIYYYTPITRGGTMVYLAYVQLFLRMK